MKIYIAHSRKFDFQKELYEPLRKSELSNIHEIIFPHERNNELFDSKDFIKSCDLVIAEVSYKSTGLGIELGWANAFDTPVVCVHKKGTKISDPLKIITDKFVEYSNTEELISGVEKQLGHFNAG